MIAYGCEVWTYTKQIRTKMKIENHNICGAVFDVKKNQ